MAPKRSAQSESVVATPTTTDPLHMVALMSGDGELFLVDRNCASVSGRCRRRMDEVQQLVAAAAAATPGVDATFDVTFGGSSYGGNSSACTTPHVRGSVQASQTPDGNGETAPADQSWKSATVPFYDCEAWSDACDGALSSARQGLPALLQLPISDLLEACRQVASSQQSAVPVHTENSRPQAGGRRSVSSPQRPHLHPFISITGANGHRLYPVIELTDVPSALLTLGVMFMYYKYKADNDGDKRVQGVPPPFTEKDAAALIAVSTLLAM